MQYKSAVQTKSASRLHAALLQSFQGMSRALGSRSFALSLLVLDDCFMFLLFLLYLVYQIGYNINMVC